MDTFSQQLVTALSSDIISLNQAASCDQTCEIYNSIPGSHYWHELRYIYSIFLLRCLLAETIKLIVLLVMHGADVLNLSARNIQTPTFFFFVIYSPSSLKDGVLVMCMTENNSTIIGSLQ